MNFPSKFVKDAVDHMASLPGIGKKSALRLILHILKREKSSVEDFGNSLISLVNNINYCSICFTISDLETCEICSNLQRDKEIICIVENTMQYKGVYHILGGLISPINGIGPNDIKINELISRVEQNSIKEIIFALSTTMEGDTTNYYLFKRLEEFNVKISSIARGIAIGDELEYTDEITLGEAISSRMPYSE